jgi:cytochrome c556
MSSSFRRALRIALLAGAVVALVSGQQQTADAHGGASGVVKERMMVMDGIAKAMKQIAAMITGKAEYDGAELRRLAASIAATGGTHLTDKFPQDSLDKPTEAVPAIWEKWDRFADIAGQLSARAGQLGDAAQGDRATVRQAFADLTKTCKDCHGEFRLKK